jgi:hypothetical protein
MFLENVVLFSRKTKRTSDSPPVLNISSMLAWLKPGRSARSVADKTSAESTRVTDQSGAE